MIIMANIAATNSNIRLSSVTNHIEADKTNPATDEYCKNGYFTNAPVT